MRRVVREATLAVLLAVGVAFCPALRAAPPAPRHALCTADLPGAPLAVALHLHRQPGVASLVDRAVRPVCGASHSRDRASGELFSLPLFAALAFAAGDALTLEMVGLFWLLAFVVYTAFNCWALRRV
jgi:hypothetical protein